MYNSIPEDELSVSILVEDIKNVHLCWLTLYSYITMHGVKSIKYVGMYICMYMCFHVSIYMYVSKFT